MVIIMKKFKYSFLTLACLNAQAALASTTAEQDIEHISVYLIFTR